MGFEPASELNRKAREIKDLKTSFEKSTDEAEKCGITVSEYKKRMQELELEMTQLETQLTQYEALLTKKKEVEKKLRIASNCHVCHVEKWQTALTRALTLSTEVSKAEGELHEIKQRVKQETKNQIRRAMALDDKTEE